MEGEPLLRQDRLYKHEDWYLAKYLHTIAEQDPQIIVTGAVDICCLFSFVFELLEDRLLWLHSECPCHSRSSVVKPSSFFPPFAVPSRPQHCWTTVLR